MIFSEEEQEQIKKIAAKNELISKLWQEYNKYQQDPTAEYYLEIVEMTKALAKEMASVRNPQKKTVGGVEVNVMAAPILLSEDKLFERIKGLLTDNEKIFAGINKGKQEMEKSVENGKDLEKEKKIKKGTDIAI